MSGKSGEIGGNCKSEPCALLQVSKNSSIVLNGRCASTPIGASRLSFSRLDTSIGGFDITRDDCSTPKIDVSAVPIFGRQNLQLLGDCQSNGDESGAMRVLRKHRAGHHIVNADKTFDDNAGPSSSGINAKGESKEANRKILGNKRSSMPNDSQRPIFKTSSKRPKSPRLLTAMRAKLRINRDKTKNVNAEVAKENKKKTTTKVFITQKNTKQMRPSSNNPLATVYNKFKITIPMSPKLGRAASPRHM